MKLIKDFTSAGKTFCFYFHRYNCHMVANSFCSLSHDKWIFDKPGHQDWEKAHPYHCPYVEWLMLNHSSEYLPVYVYKYRCGHYQTGQGQHRLCIAGNKRYSIPVRLDTFKDQVCGYCQSLSGHILKSF